MSFLAFNPTVLVKDSYRSHLANDESFDILVEHHHIMSAATAHYHAIAKQNCQKLLVGKNNQVMKNAKLP